MFRRALLAGSLGVAVAGCAAMAPQQLGQVIGTVAGSVVVPGIGAPIGGLIGLLAGMVVQKKVDQVTEQHERVELGRELATAPGNGPAGADGQTPPVGTLTRVWVDETWHDGRVIAGSFQERYTP